MKKIIMLICLALIAGISFNEAKANSAPGEFLGTIATLSYNVDDSTPHPDLIFDVPQLSYPVIGVSGPGDPQYSRRDRRITIKGRNLLFESDGLDYIDIDILVNMSPNNDVTYGHYVLRINYVRTN